MERLGGRSRTSPRTTRREARQTQCIGRMGARRGGRFLFLLDNNRNPICLAHLPCACLCARWIDGGEMEPMRIDRYCRIRYGLKDGEKPTRSQRNTAAAMCRNGTLDAFKSGRVWLIRWEG